MVPVFVPELKNPNYPCDTDRPEAVGEYLISRNFLEPGERVRSVAPIDHAGRNIVWRVRTGSRSFVVKQFRSRPTGERDVPTVDDLYRGECQFYRTARIANRNNRSLPAVLHQDCRAACMILEDVGVAEPNRLMFTSADTEALAWFLVSLHHHSQSVPTTARYRNHDVVGWQMAHLFRQARSGPSGNRGCWLARFSHTGLAARHALEDAMAAQENEGANLVHGDFSAANWVRGADGSVRVVDGEFSFFGPPEFDAGAFLGSLLHTRQASEVVAAAVGVIAGSCVGYRPRLTVAFAAAHVCELLERGRDSGTPWSGSAASVLLRQLGRAAEQSDLRLLIPKSRD